MALTTAQQVRERIRDFPLVADDTYTFDGSGSAFALPHRNLTSGTAFVQDANGQWSATGATFNVSGYVTFSGIGTALSAFRVRYVHSVFSDEVIGHFTAVGGTVAGAAREAARSLRFDDLRRAKWAAPDGTEYDDTAAMKALNDLIDDLDQEIEEGEIGSGGFVSWAQGQGNW